MKLLKFKNTSYPFAMVKGIITVIFLYSTLYCCSQSLCYGAVTDYKKNQAIILSNKGYGYYVKKDFKKAEKYLKDALRYDDNNFNALAMLGSICYYSQQLANAEEYWKKALSIDPTATGLKAKYENLKKEISVEDDFDQVVDQHFDIRAENDYLDFDSYDIRRYLRKAYREIGQDFDYFPHRKIMVLIYSKKSFEKIKGKNHYIGGLYDGKIRLPIRDAFKNKKDFEKLLWHEYTHVVVRDIAGKDCPTWINEGLAKYQEARYLKTKKAVLPEITKRLRNKKPLIPLSQLDASYKKFNSPEIVMLAYEQGYSMINYIADKYGLWYIRRLLNKLKTNKNVEKVIKEVLHISMDRFEDEWMNRLKWRYR